MPDYTMDDLTKLAESAQEPTQQPVDPMKDVMGKMQEYGWSKEAAAGVVGNLFHESAGKSHIWGDKGTSFGLAQWHAERRKGLADYATKIGKPADDIDAQIQFLNHELMTDYSDAANALRDAKTPEEAAQAFSKYYEKPGKPMMGNRIAAAKRAYGMADLEKVAEATAAQTPTGKYQYSVEDLKKIAGGQPTQKKQYTLEDLKKIAGQKPKPPEEITPELVMRGAPEAALATGPLPFGELATGAKLGLVDLTQRAARSIEPGIMYGFGGKETPETIAKDPAKAAGDRLMQELFPQGVPEAKGLEAQVVKGIGESWPGLVALASLQPFGAPAAFGLWGLTEEDPLKGAGKGVLLGGALKVVGKAAEAVKDPVMQWMSRIAGGAGVGGTASAIAGGKPEEITRDALIFGLFEALGMPRGKSAEWFKEKGVDPEIAKTLGEADIYSPEFAKAVNQVGEKLALPFPEKVGETFVMKGTPEEVSAREGKIAEMRAVEFGKARYREEKEAEDAYYKKLAKKVGPEAAQRLRDLRQLEERKSAIADLAKPAEPELGFKISVPESEVKLPVETPTEVKLPSKAEETPVKTKGASDKPKEATELPDMDVQLDRLNQGWVPYISDNIYYLASPEMVDSRFGAIPSSRLRVSKEVFERAKTGKPTEVLPPDGAPLPQPGFGEEGFIDVGPLLTPGLEAADNFKQGVLSLVLPTAKSPEHLTAGEVVGHQLGAKNREGKTAFTALKPFRRELDKLGVNNPSIPLEENVGVNLASALSTGKNIPTQFTRYAKVRDKIYSRLLKGLEDAGVGLQTIRENYFPGVWQKNSIQAFHQALNEAVAQGRGRVASEGQADPTIMDLNLWSKPDKDFVKNRVNELLESGNYGKETGALAFLTRKPFEGKESFRKAKTFDDIMTGVEFGLRPVSNNPVDLDLLKMEEMARSLMANRAFNEFKDRGMQKFIHVTEDVPEGWSKIDDKYGTVYGPYDPSKGARPLYGYRVFTKPAADILNNYLSSSLYNNPYVGAPFRGWMAMGNLLNQAQLGMGSMFHVGFTAGVAQIEAVGRVVQDMYGLLVARNRTPTDVISSIAKTPIAMARPFLRGENLREWANPQMDVPVDVPVGQLPSAKEHQIAQINKAVELAGGGFDMERGLRTTQADKMVRDWYSGVGGKIKAIARSPVAFTEATMWPTMTYWVPRVKATVFADAATRIMEMNPDKTMMQLRPQFRKAWNITDMMAGQVQYDRVFMRNAAKNTAQAIIRAPGWTGGSLALFGGAVKDTATFFRDWARDRKPPENLPPRMAHTIATLGTAAVLNGMMTYIITGERPKGMDWWAFRDGGVDDKGNPTRMLLPTYAKELFAWARGFTHTAVAKAHPLLSLGLSIARNRTFDNNMIWDEEKGVWNKDFVLNVGGEYIKAYEPFWTRGIRQVGEREGGIKETLSEHPGKLIGPEFGVMPATRAYTMTALDEVMSRANKIVVTRTPEKAAERKLRVEAQSLVRQGKADKAVEKIQKAIQDNKVDVDTGVGWLEEGTVPAKELQFKRLPLVWKAKSLLKANPQEMEMLMPLLIDHIDRAKDKDLEKAMPFIDELLGGQKQARGATKQ